MGTDPNLTKCINGICQCNKDGVCPCKVCTIIYLVIFFRYSFKRFRSSTKLYLFTFLQENVEGDKCDKCKAGTFGLDDLNPYGCTKCFCFGRATSCEAAQLTWGQLRLNFSRNVDFKENVAEIPVSI